METPITKIIKLQDDLTYEESTKPLGKGALGKVFRGTFRNNPVAVKRVQLVDLDSATYQREETAMGKMNHDNVLKLLHVVQDSYFKYLVLELCLGTVRDYINGTYTEAMPSELDALKQMASGLHYIHSQGFVHRDIKPANVLISPAIVLKISDFGVSRPVTNSGSFSTTSGPQGTKIYFAPEFLMLEESIPEERANIRANVSIDYFSLGCLFFSYLTKGGHPFAEPKAKNQFFIVSNIVEGKKFMDKYELSRNYYEIIDGMTQIVSSDRWNLDKVIAYLNSIAL